MDTRDENYISMAIGTNNVVRKYKAKWENIPRFVKEAGDLDLKIEELNRTTKESLIETSGATKGKAAAREDATNLIVRLAKPACVYALDNNNMQMHDQLSVSRGSLSRLQDTVIVERLNNIYDILFSEKDQLPDYGISETDLADARTSIDTLRALVTQPRGLITERKTKNTIITEQIAGLRSIFYRLDSLMKLFEGTEFYTEYRNARIIVDSGTRKKKEE